jgi:hypothetical protein
MNLKLDVFLGFLWSCGFVKDRIGDRFVELYLFEIYPRRLGAVGKSIDDKWSHDPADLYELCVSVFFFDLLIIAARAFVKLLLGPAVVNRELKLDNKTVVVCQFYDIVPLA